MAQASAYLILYLLIKFSCGEYESAPADGLLSGSVMRILATSPDTEEE